MCRKLFAIAIKRDVLKSYIEKLFNDIWPKQEDQWFQFLLTWPTVLTIYENQISLMNNSNKNPLSLTDKTSYNKSSNNCLLNFDHNYKYIKIYLYSMDILNRIANSNAAIVHIELAQQNSEQTTKLIKLLSDNQMHLNRRLEFDNFDRLIGIRLNEVNELGKF